MFHSGFVWLVFIIVCSITGIGHGIATALYKHKARVVAVDIKEDGLNALKQEVYKKTFLEKKMGFGPLNMCLSVCPRFIILN